MISVLVTEGRLGLRDQVTTHMNRIGKEVGSISDQEDQAAFRLGISSNMREFQQQTRRNPKDDSNEQTSEEVEQEDANTLKQTQQCQTSSFFSRFVFLRRLKQDNGDGVVEDTLAEDDGVEFGIDLVRVEDGEDRDGIRGRQCGSY